jgi:hypothetical protein
MVRTAWVRRDVLRLAIVAVCLLLGHAQLAWAQQTKWYFAEGATGPSFEQDLLLANPSASTAQMRITFLRSVGDPVILTFDLPATTRKTIRVNTIAGLEAAEVSTIVESLNAVPIVAERTLYWGGAAKRGGHNETGIDMPRTEWYLAEGASGPFFHSYVLLANPGDQDASATVQFFRDDGIVVTQTYSVPAKRRYTVDVNGVPGMGTGSFGAKIMSTVPILVERAMYWSSFEGGSDAAAAPAPSTNWLFAEGTTLSAFQTFILLSNPNVTATTATVIFHLESGALVTKTVTVPGQGRYTVYVNSYADMANVSFATTVTSVLPIVAERAMYWGDYIEGTAVAGMPQAALKWGFAEGRTGVHEGVSFETFYLLLNPTPAPLTVHATFYLEDGTGSVYDFTIPANARYTLYGGAPPRTQGQDIAAFFEGSAPFVAERATYWGADRYGGHGSAGVPWQGTIATPPLLPRAAAPLFSVPSGTYNTDLTTNVGTTTPGALIRYTTDGSEPTASSPVAGAAMTFSASATIRAKTFAPNYTPSYTTSVTYTLQAPVPVFAKPSGSYAAPTEFGISQPLINAYIRYTTDGSEPTESHPLYMSPIQAPYAQTLTLKAKTFRTGWTPSATVTAVYQVSQGLLDTPVPTPAAGVYSVGQVVSLSAQPFVTIRFTTDGSDPTAASAIYTTPLTVNSPITLKARAFYTGYSPSNPLVARYDLKVAKPEITPGDSVLFASGTSATVTTSTPDVIFRYTFDRNDPTAESPQMFGGIWVNVGDTLKIQAYKDGWVPSEVAAATYTNGNVPTSQGTFSVTGASLTGFNSTSSYVTFQLANAVLDEASVLILRNGSSLASGLVTVANATVGNIAIASASVAGLIDGRNELEVYATDFNQLEVYTREVIWAGNRTATVRVNNSAGTPIAAAQVRLVLQADDALSVDGITDGGGNFTGTQLPTSEPFTVEVSASGYRPATVTLGPGTTFQTVALARDNLTFSNGTQGWTGTVTAMSHSEASDPLENCSPFCGPLRGYPSHSLTADPPAMAAAVEPPVETNIAPCYPNCDLRQLLRTAPGSSSNTDILLQSGFEISRTATYTFKASPGARKVRVRYRVQTAEIMPHVPYAPGTLPIPDRYTIRLRSNTTNRTVTDNRTVADLYNANMLDDNQATGWLTLELTLDQDAEEVELYLYAYNEFDYGWSTGIWVDKIEEEIYSVTAFQLHDFRDASHTHPRAATPERLEYLSAAPHNYYGGNTRVNGTLAIRAPVGSQVSDITLQILQPGVATPIAVAPLVSELAPALLRTVGADGVVAVTASQLMFAINSAQFQTLDLQNESTLTAQVRVTFAGGQTITRPLGRNLIVLARYVADNRNPNGRDTGNCIGLQSPFPCGGDDWAHPLTVRFITGVLGVLWNDFSNMNGGAFPWHRSHMAGLDIDGSFANYDRRDADTAATMIAYLNQYGRRIQRVFVAYRQVETDPFWRAIRNVTLTDGRLASQVIQPEASHTDHFHWRLDLARLP